MMSSSIKRLPLRVRFAVAAIVGAAIVAALVLFVDHNNGPLSETPAAANHAQQVQENEQARVLVTQQQAPHRTGFGASVTSPTAAAISAVTAYVTAQIAQGSTTGPLDGPASCRSAGGDATRAVLHCDITAGNRSADLSLRYPFDVVVVPLARQVTFCQVITSPDPSVPSPPVSAACR